MILTYEHAVGPTGKDQLAPRKSHDGAWQACCAVMILLMTTVRLAGTEMSPYHPASPLNRARIIT